MSASDFIDFTDVASRVGDRPVDWTSRLRDLQRRIGMRRLDRQTWRATFLGQERVIIRDYLLEIARYADAASPSERLVVFKAAYAVQSFHDGDLATFAQLLVKEQPLSAEWVDVLVEALAEQPRSGTPLTGLILEALDRFCKPYYTRTNGSGKEGEGTDDSYVRSVDWVAHHVALCGYKLSWVSECLSRFKDKYRIPEIVVPVEDTINSTAEDTIDSTVEDSIKEFVADKVETVPFDSDESGTSDIIVIT